MPLAVDHHSSNQPDGDVSCIIQKSHGYPILMKLYSATMDSLLHS